MPRRVYALLALLVLLGAAAIVAVFGPPSIRYPLQATCAQVLGNPVTCAHVFMPEALD